MPRSRSLESSGYEKFGVGPTSKKTVQDVSNHGDMRTHILKDLKVSVRRARKTEFPGIFDLRWKVLREPLGLPRGSETDNLEMAPGVFQIVAVDRVQPDNTELIVGTGRIHRIPDNQFQVRYMATHPEHEGRRIGHRVLAELEALVKPAEPDAIILNSRESVVGFYEKAGYEQIGPAEPFHGIPHISMKKQLQ